MVDTSQLIKDENDLVSTPKVACILKNGLMYKQILSSPENSILGKIYAKTQLRPEMVKERQLFGDRCLFGFNIEMLKLAGSKDIFILGENDNGVLLWSASSMLKSFFNKVWMLQDKVYRHNSVFFYNIDKPRIGWE